MTKDEQAARRKSSGLRIPKSSEKDINNVDEDDVDKEENPDFDLKLH